MTVAVDGAGHARLQNDLAEEGHVATRVLRRLEEQGRHPAGGVVDNGEERNPWEVLPKPVVMTGVYLKKHPFLGIAFPARTMLHPALLRSRRTDSFLRKDAP